jgi:predicted ArsR family transcriptional regulator
VESRIARSEERGRTGRPATRYSLTEAGDHLFPKNYDLLNVAIIDAVADELGPDAAKRMLRRVSDDRYSTVNASLRGRSLEERVEALKNFYLEGDPHMEVQKNDGVYRLVERNCPYINTAMQRPALCSISVNALSRILGVRVEREKKFQNGDGRCVFLVHTDEPIDAENWEFKLESEMAGSGK